MITQFTQRAIKRVVLLFAVLLIAGCSTSREIVDTGREILDFDTSAKLTFKADSNVNLDYDGRPSPLVIRVFKLADNRQFEREDFLSLYEQADKRLGDDLQGTIKLKEIAPGEQRNESIELLPETRFLGVLAEYSDFEDAKTMLVLPIRAHNKNDFTVLVNQSGLNQAE